MKVYEITKKWLHLSCCFQKSRRVRLVHRNVYNFSMGNKQMIINDIRLSVPTIVYFNTKGTIKCKLTVTYNNEI